MKLFTAVIVVISEKARVSAIAINFHPGVIFWGKVRGLPL
jgi:hypothetical protein